MPEHPWNPPPQGGYNPTHNYNVPSSQTHQKNAPPPRGWQQSVRMQSSNTVVGPLKNFFSTDFPEAGIYTAMFSISAPSQQPGGLPPIQPDSSIRCQAVVSWVVEGNQVQRVFDIGDGTTISGVGAGAIIQAQDLTATLPGMTGTNGIEYQVSVSVAKGTRGQFQIPVVQPGAADSVNGVVQPVPLIIGPVTLAPTQDASFVVPPSAGVIGVKISAIDVTDATVRPTFVTATQRNASLTFPYYRWLPDADPSFVPLVPGAQAIQVINNSASDSVIVSLDWAIDG